MRGEGDGGMKERHDSSLRICVPGSVPVCAGVCQCAGERAGSVPVCDSVPGSVPVCAVCVPGERASVCQGCARAARVTHAQRCT